MVKKVLSSFTSGKITVWYLMDCEPEQGLENICGMTLLPTEIADRFTPDGNYRVENLVQLKLMHDAYPGDYSMGITMRNSESAWKLKYVRQEVKELTDGKEIITVLESDKVRAFHHLTLRDGKPYAWVLTEVENISAEEQTLEMISSFSVCDFSPVGAEERMHDLNFYRLSSRWAQEGKLIRQNLVEDLHMEPSWVLQSVQTERCGQIGSQPVRGWFPWGVLEDEKNGFMIGAQVCHPGSWQMELYQRDEKPAFSGGLADREFGQFTKKLAPGTHFQAPGAVIAASMGNIDDISYALTLAQEEAVKNIPACENDLPFIFNEYCTTWGNPTHENLKKIVDQIRGKGFKYLVIDAGWYQIGDDGLWYNDQGDWNVSETRFPGGLTETVKLIRDAGMVPGIWFEFETIGCNSKAYTELEDLQLKMDGLPLNEAGKHYFDMKKPETIAYLTEKVIGLLKKYDIGYLKVDYNGTFGVGPDGEESRGEENRKSVLASREFFSKIRSEIPDIVIENCASGGHREEPSMMAVSSMCSFSDAHEPVCMPVIAANLHRAILPRQSQIWAVMRAGDSEKRLIWTMTNTFLGRCCLSGDIYDLDEGQWNIIRRGMEFYKKAVPVIRSGKSELVRDEKADYQHLKGSQIVRRTGTDDASGQMLITVHRFEETSGSITLEVPADFEIAEIYSEEQVVIIRKEDCVIIEGLTDYSACGILLKK